MNIAEKLTTIAENQQKVFAAGKAEAVAHNAAILTDCNAVLPDKGAETADTLEQVPQRIGEIPSYEDGYKAGGNGVLLYATGLSSFFKEASFPDGTDIEIYCPNFSKTLEQFAQSAKGLRKMTLICDDTSGSCSFVNAFFGSSVEILDISKFIRTPTVATNAFIGSKIKTILGAIDCSLLTSTINVFVNMQKLEDVALVPNTLKLGISFSGSPELSDASIQSIIDGLADLTGQTAQTLTLHKTVGAKLTEAQKDTITEKNWTLVY
jgi:hypothetical protein